MSRTIQKSIAVVMAMVMLFSQTLSMSARPSDALIASVDESVLVLDEAALDEAMEELNELDEFLSDNEGVTYAELEAVESELIINMDNSTAPLGMDSESEPPLGIPSFLWGCILGVVGILIVYIITDGDTDETKKALWGMLVWVGVWIILYVGVFSTAALWY
jgi:hypothetical protein